MFRNITLTFYSWELTIRAQVKQLLAPIVIFLLVEGRESDWELEAYYEAPFLTIPQYSLRIFDNSLRNIVHLPLTS